MITTYVGDKMSIIKKVLRPSFSLLVKASPVIASKVIYYKTFREKLNLKNPTTFNEKLMWLKLKEEDTLKTRYTDKYSVRDYIKENGYENILIELYKVYDSVEEINFEELPNSFIIKCTHGSGFNIICSNKEQLDRKNTILQIKKWMKIDYSLVSCEPHYSKIKPRIIVERFLGDSDGKVPIDYKIHCFHGEPKIIELIFDRGTSQKKCILLNLDWETLPYNEQSINFKEVIQKPEKSNEMLEIARSLSSPFTYVRVDLYYYNKEIFFGELTFTPDACLFTDLSDEAGYKIGNLLDLTKSCVK